MQRPAHLARLAFAVQRSRDGQGFGVGLQHGVDARPRAVEALDAGEALLCDGLRSGAAGSHVTLELADGGLDDGRARVDSAGGDVLASVTGGVEL